MARRITGNPEVDAQLGVIDSALRELEGLGWVYMLVVPQGKSTDSDLTIFSNVNLEGKKLMAQSVLQIENEEQYLVAREERGNG